MVEIDGGGSKCIQVAITDAAHHDGMIFFIKVPAEPGGWRVDAGSVPLAAFPESGDDVFIFAGLSAVLSSEIPHTV